MDFGSNWPLIFILIVIILLFVFLRRGGGARRQPEIVQSLLTDVKLDQALVETFYIREKPRKFEMTSWQMHRTKLDFLGEELQATLAETFGIIEDFNQQIKTIKRSKVGDHKSIDVTKLKELLAKCRKGLEDWMMDKIGQKELPTRYPSLMGFLFGGR